MTEKPQTLRQLLVDFMSYTTSHGLGRLVASSNTLWKLFWIISFLGASTMFSYQVYDLLAIYLSRPVQTFVTVKYEKQLPFPAVTICNLNMIKSNRLPKELSDFFTANNTYENAKSKVNITRAEKVELKNSEYDYSWYAKESDEKTFESDDDISDEYPDEGELDEETTTRALVELLIGKLGPSELYSHGHAMDDLISTCSWKGVDCKNGNLSKFWIRSWNYRYGNCYTFNNGISVENKPSRVLKTSKPGPSQGLTLTLNIEQHLYVASLAKGAGVRVLLHSQGVMPFPFEEGFSVTPGMSTSVGIVKRVIKRLDRFGNGDQCTEKPALSAKNIYKTHRNITQYSLQACLNSCLGRSQWFTCGCSESSYPSGDVPCNAFNKNERNCLRFMRNLFNNDVLTCIQDCKRPCSEETYLRTISSSQWPSTAYKMYSSSESGSKNESHQSSDSTMELKIFYSAMNHEAVEEKFSYQMTNLLADIGGQLGLWIGISALTVCELLELILKFVTLALAKLKTGHRVTQVTQFK